MTPDQELHLASIQKDFCLRISSKYRKGAAEHGGTLQDMSLIDSLENALEETLDQYTYIYHALEEVNKLKK